MQKDFDRFNEMVVRLLTVARLDTSAIPAATTLLDWRFGH